MKSEMVQLQQNAVQNHTATMLEIGTSLLSQTAEQTRKLTDVETQVCSQSGFHKAVNCRQHFPNSFLSNALPHKTFQHRAPGNTLRFLVLTALMIDPCYVSFFFFHLVSIFSSVCVTKVGLSRKLDQHLTFNKQLPAVNNTSVRLNNE